MTKEQKQALLQEAAFICIDDMMYRVDVCVEDEFYYTDEEEGEQYCESYDDIDLTRPDVSLYKLQLIEIAQ